MDSGLRDGLDRELADLLNYNPPAVQKVGRSVVYRLPFPFFDPHIDSRLSLQRVVLLPSFSRQVAQVINQDILALKRAGKSLPLVNFDYEDVDDRCAMPTKGARRFGTPRNELTDACSVARFYMHVSYQYCSAVGSTLGLHPNSHTWLSVFDFVKAGAEPDEGRSAMAHQYHLEICRDFNTGKMCVPRGVWNCLDQEARAGITEVSNRFRTLVTYQFFAAMQEYDDLLEKMGDMASRETFAPLPSSVSDFPPEELPPPLMVDAAVPPWEALQEQQKCRRSARLFRPSTQKPQIPNPPRGKRKRGPPSLDIKRPRSSIITVRTPTVDTDDVCAFIQHAWTQSVIDDTTFIVFQCGKYERIAVRHRDSRTLFISDLIDVHSCQDPGYGMIQAGLYLLIIRDAMDRASQIKQIEKFPAPNDKKLQGSTGATSHSRTVRRKTRSVLALEERVKTLITDECDKRDLALFYIRHSPFNSPSPAAFVRRGRAVIPGVPCSIQRQRMSGDGQPMRQYHAQEYFEIALLPAHESGATGQIHKATIRLTLSDGRLLSRHAIAKIAFHHFQRERLRHEYNVYRYMAAKGVRCVATIFGLFEDVGDKSSVLIMSDAGVSLYDRELRKNPGAQFVENVSVTREEREVFKQALSEIHKAEVRHYDIRPMNLLIDEDGNATIIDFDMAKMEAGRHSRKREYDDLCLLLSGHYFPPNQYPSSTTTRSAQADSDVMRNL